VELHDSRPKVRCRTELVCTKRQRGTAPLRWWAGQTGYGPRRSDINLFRYGKSIIDLDA
jgi:hypothetical protein